MSLKCSCTQAETPYPEELLLPFSPSLIWGWVHLCFAIITQICFFALPTISFSQPSGQTLTGNSSNAAAWCYQPTFVTMHYVLTITPKIPFFFFCCTHSMWKLWGQGSNLHQSCNLRHSSENTGSLTCCAIREFLGPRF